MVKKITSTASCKSICKHPASRAKNIMLRELYLRFHCDWSAWQEFVVEMVNKQLVIDWYKLYKKNIVLNAKIMNPNDNMDYNINTFIY